MRLIFLFALLLTSITSPGLERMHLLMQTLENPYLKFATTQLDLGTVKKGSQIEMIYHFTNISEEEVQIDLVSSCECTELEWSGKAIKPGERSYIKAIFDSNKKDENEIIDIDIILKNTDPESGDPVFIIVNYSYELTD